MAKNKYGSVNLDLNVSPGVDALNFGAGYGGPTGSGTNAGDFSAMGGTGNLDSTAFDQLNFGGDESGGFGDVFRSFSGTSKLGAGEKANFGQMMGGYLDVETGKSVGGMAGGIFDVASTLGEGYMKWRGMKDLEKARAAQQEQWMKNYRAQKHQYNQEAQSINAARESASSGGHRIEQMA